LTERAQGGGQEGEGEAGCPAELPGPWIMT